jgi:G3E family GTPase
MKSKIALHIFAGFFGVGKTTAIANLLRSFEKDESIAIVMSERGDVGIDRAIIDLAGQDFQLRKRKERCVCLTVGPSVDQTLWHLLQEVQPERIIMECCSTEKPGDIVDIIHFSEFTAGIEIRPIINIVDPGEFIKPQMMALSMYRDQVEASDILVANRCDLVDGPTLLAFYHRARHLFPPKGAILTTTFGRLPQDILKIGGGSARCRERRMFENGKLKKIDTNPAASPNSARSEYQETGWLWPSEVIFDHEAIMNALTMIKGDEVGLNVRLERMKGLFHTDQGCHLLEIVMKEVYQRSIQYKGANRCQIIFSGHEADGGKTIQDLLESCILR